MTSVSQKVITRIVRLKQIFKRKKEKVLKKSSIIIKKRIQHGIEGIVDECIIKPSVYGTITLIQYPTTNRVVSKHYFNEYYFENEFNTLKFLNEEDPENKYPIVRLIGYNTNKRTLVTEKCHTDLFEWMTYHPLSDDEIVSVVEKVMEGIAFCHSKGIIHTDIKPENIGVIVNTETKKIKDIRILDFGHAITVTSQSQYYETRYLYGSRRYTSPKVLKYAVIDVEDVKKIDYWELSVMMYVMLKKDYPFKNVSEIKESSLNYNDTCVNHPLIIDVIYNNII